MRCGANVFLSDTHCMSCGLPVVEARSPTPAPAPEAPKEPDPPLPTAPAGWIGWTRIPDWARAFQDRFYYAVWIAPAPIFALLLALRYELLPSSLGVLLLAVALLPWGASMVLLSRPLAEVRSSTPVFLRVIGAGWGGLIDLAPWFFRLMGSAVIGVAIGLLVWMACHGMLPALIIGGVVAVTIWLWTWFVFPDIEE